MKTQKIFLSAVLITLCATPAWPVASYAQPVKSTTKTARVDVARFIEAVMEINQIPGLAYAVARRGEVIASGVYGVGNVEWKAPLTRSSRFQLASVTKLFTGLLLMRMVEDGKVDLDQPVSAYIKETPPSWSGITLRHLANHSSGIADDYDSPTPASLDALLAATAAKPLDWAPGQRARYGFNDFAILRLAMETATGKSYEQLLEHYVIRPLNLSDTAFLGVVERGPARRGKVLAERVVVYGRDGNELRTHDFLYPHVAYAAGGLTSSISDMEKLAAAIGRGDFLSPRSMKQLTTPATLGDGSKGEFGIGWIARTHHGVPVAGHSGGPGLADLLYFPTSETVVVVLHNQQAVFPWLAGTVADFYVPPPAPSPIADGLPKVSATVLASLRAAVAGKVGLAGWSATARTEFLPWLEGDGAVLLRSLGQPLTVSLVAERVNKDSRERIYSIRFERAMLRWAATVNADGTLEALIPSSS